MRFMALAFLFILMSSVTYGSGFSVGRNGVNSKVTGLDGTGVRVGQVEAFRPGKAGFDASNFTASQTVPTQVYVQTPTGGGPVGENAQIDFHATGVAGVIIGKTQPFSVYQGVAPNAELHSLASQGVPQLTTTLGFDRIATLNGAPVRAINFSAAESLSFPEDVDGNSLLTQYVDWSSSQHNVVYVTAWANQSNFEISAPSDNFNGITVAASGFDPNGTTGTYDRFSSVNSTNFFQFDAIGPRTSIDILAPGEDIRVLEPGDVEMFRSGTSYATPHVTGAIALLHQHMTNQGVSPSINVDARKHQVTKAIILNSADKLAGVHGSSRTILDSNGDSWLESEAFTSRFQSLDDQLGVGHLNVKSAIDQFDGGQHSPGNVPNIGWAFDGVGVGGRDEYFLPSGSSGYIAITLDWDRELEITDLSNNYNAGDQFFVDELNDLNLFLMTADGTDLILDSVSRSTTFEDNVEHIFTNDYPAGDYKIVVQHAGGSEGGFGDFQEYALAWRLGDDPPVLEPDFDGDFDVDEDDLDIFEDNFGTDSRGDADGDGDTDGADFLAWQRGITTGVATQAASSAVPEPSTLLLLFIGLPFIGFRKTF